MTHSSAESQLHEPTLGRDIINRWVALLKAVRLYQGNNAGLQAASESLRQVMCEFMKGNPELDITYRQGALYVGRQHVREGAVASSNYHRLIDILRAAKIASFRVEEQVTIGELEVFARLVTETATGSRQSKDFLQELGVRGLGSIEVELFSEDEPVPDEVESEMVAPSDEAEPLSETLDPERDEFSDGAKRFPEELDSKKVAKRIYLRSISMVKSMFHDLHVKNRISARRVKRVIQEMIGSLEGNPEFLINLTCLKNYDEYTFNHSVNVGVMAIALGKHIGLGRNQLYVLGQAGMLHDLGKLCIPREILNKPGRLLPEELTFVKAHPEEGFLSIASQLGIADDTIGVALGAYEHHMNEDGTGYPRRGCGRRRTLLSRIVAIVDRYDAMTSARVYRGASISPPKSLAIMSQAQGAHQDRILLKYFMNMMGYFPLGTVVRLSDQSIGIVLRGESEPEFRHLPSVLRVLDGDGCPLSESQIDLSKLARDGGEGLHILEVLEASRYGIEVMDYIL